MSFVRGAGGMAKSKLAILVVTLPLLTAGCLGIGVGENVTDAGTPTVPATEIGPPADTGTPTEPATDESASTDATTSSQQAASPGRTGTPSEPGTVTAAPSGRETETHTPATPGTRMHTPGDPMTETATPIETEAGTPTVTESPSEPGTDTPTETPPSSSLERVNPAEFGVVPGTTVLFEFEADDWYRTEWYVDGERVGGSLDPDVATYYERRNRIFRTVTFDVAGTREVSARVHTGNGSVETLNWTVDVNETADSAPTVEDLSPDPNASIEYVWNEELTLGATVADPDGDLDRVVWWENQRDAIPAVDAIDGDRATSNVSMVCNECTPSMWVVDENGAIAYGGWGPLERADVLTVEIVGTNAPVTRGETLTVTAAIENNGSEPHRQAYELEITQSDGEVRSGEPVDRGTVSVAPGSTERLTLTDETTAETPDDLTLRVSNTVEGQGEEVTVSVSD